MKIIYIQQGMALRVYGEVDGERFYIGFWWSYLNFVEAGV